MNTISTQSSSLAASLASLAAQTQSQSSAASDASSSSPSADVLDVTGNDSSSEGLSYAAQQIALQNRYSALADYSEALAANNAAATALKSDPSGALSSQGNVDPQAALSLGGGD